MTTATQNEMVATVKVASAIQKAIAATPTGVSFIRIKDYLSKTSGEIAHHLVNVGVSFAKAKEKDIEFLKNLDVLLLMDMKSTKPMLEIARVELLNSLISPDENRSQAQADAYTHIESIQGVKIHNETGIVYVYAMTVSKEIVTKGTYKTVNSSEKTIAKNELKKLLKSTQYRQFLIPNITAIKANGDTLELG